MLRNRQDGLVSLHAIWVTILTTAGFLVFAVGTQLSGLIKLTPGFNRNLYFLAAFIGMLVASRVYLGWVDKLARLSWSDAFYVTAQQVARLALVMFGVAFAELRDHSVVGGVTDAVVAQELDAEVVDDLLVLGHARGASAGSERLDHLWLQARFDRRFVV